METTLLEAQAYLTVYAGTLKQEIAVVTAAIRLATQTDRPVTLGYEDRVLVHVIPGDKAEHVVFAMRKAYAAICRVLAAELDIAGAEVERQMAARAGVAEADWYSDKGGTPAQHD